MKAVYITIGLLLVGGIGYAAYMYFKKPTAPSRPLTVAEKLANATTVGQESVVQNDLNLLSGQSISLTQSNVNSLNAGRSASANNVNSLNAGRG